MHVIVVEINGAVYIETENKSTPYALNFCTPTYSFCFTPIILPLSLLYIHTALKLAFTFKRKRTPGTQHG